MDASAFVATLKDLAPTREALLNCAYGEEEAGEYIDSFNCRPRASALDIDSHQDAMLELIKQWDVSSINVGDLVLHAEPRAVGRQLEVGKIEVDKVMYRIESRDYVLLDHDRPGRVLCNVAPHGGALLDALSQVAHYYSRTAVEQIELDDEEAALRVKEEMLRSLGGEMYEAFCTTLLGI